MRNRLQDHYVYRKNYNESWVLEIHQKVLEIIQNPEKVAFCQRFLFRLYHKNGTLQKRQIWSDDILYLVLKQQIVIKR